MIDGALVALLKGVKELEEGSQQLIVQQDGAELDSDEFEHWMKRTCGGLEPLFER